MKITSLLRKLIVESSRFEVLYNQNVKPQEKGDATIGKKPEGTMSFETLKQFIFTDPTTRVPEGFDKEDATPKDMEKVHVGKYTNWLIDNFKKPKDRDFTYDGEKDPKNPEYKKALKEFHGRFLEDLYKQTERLEFYDKAKQYLPQEKRQINQLGVRDLFDIFSNFQMPEKKKKEQEKKEAKKTREGFNHAGGEVIYQGPTWTVIKISDKGTTGKDAAIYYGGYKDHRGGESDWCTSSPGLNYFDTYIKDGPLYVVFPNDDKGQVGTRTQLPKERYQFHFPSNQFMDRDDHQIDLVQSLNGEGKINMSELKELFKPEFAIGLTSNDKTQVSITYSDSSYGSSGAAGKFIALYGFEELFSSLPKQNVRNILIKNTSSTQFSYPLPESIGQFTELESIMIQNCISSVPSSIANCKNLMFISLPDNKNLKSIPESIKNLDLSFVNVKGCAPELVSGQTIPKELLDKLMDAGLTKPSEKGFYYMVG